jgi:hypothetical protein
MRARILLFLCFVFSLTAFAEKMPTQLIPPDSIANRMMVKNVKWQYNIPWEWKVEVPKEVVIYYRTKTRPKWTGYFTYYSKYIEPNDKGVSNNIAGLKATITEARTRFLWNYEDEIMFVVSMVQQLKYLPDSILGLEDYEKYPVETLMDDGGDCEDKAILCAALLKKMGYDVSMIFIETDDKSRSHIALGVNMQEVHEGSYFPRNGKQYYYVETTIPGWGIGEIPEEWDGLPGVVIEVN